ncbi:hypothetical protein Goe9_c00330 [Bacillus phage vB_BsuM-Goe9]|nr:hypothetical protein Goe9_c00330 [Bacillus phage vB_BsuM-Goe9]
MSLKHAKELKILRREKHPPKISWKNILGRMERELNIAVNDNKDSASLQVSAKDTNCHDVQEAVTILRDKYGYHVSVDNRNIYPDGATWVITCSNF